MAGPSYDPNRPGRPPCYGQLYDSDNRECRSCPYQGTCRDELIRLRSRPTVPTVPSTPRYYAPSAPAPSYTSTMYPSVAAPAIPQAPTYASAYQRPYAAPVVPAPTQAQPYNSLYGPRTAPAVPQPVPTPQLPPAQTPVPYQLAPYGYGSIPDQYYPVITSAPTPFRPQFMGESFAERVVKNAALAAFEALIAQVWIAVRQMMWLPEPIQRPGPSGPPVIDVTPKR